MREISALSSHSLRNPYPSGISHLDTRIPLDSIGRWELRWGEVIALRRSDIDLKARTARVREQLIELDGGDMMLALPKSRAGKRTVSIPLRSSPR